MAWLKCCNRIGRRLCIALSNGVYGFFGSAALLYTANSIISRWLNSNILFDEKVFWSTISAGTLLSACYGFSSGWHITCTKESYDSLNSDATDDAFEAHFSDQPRSQAQHSDTNRRSVAIDPLEASRTRAASSTEKSEHKQRKQTFTPEFLRKRGEHPKKDGSLHENLLGTEPSSPQPPGIDINVSDALLPSELGPPTPFSPL